MQQLDTRSARRLTHPAVEAELARLIAGDEIGIQVAATSGDRLLVDSWAGTVSAGGGAVGRATLFPVFSVWKAVVATAVHLQVARGLLDYEAPIASYWPEYGAHGKDAITVGHVLSHRAGVPQMPDDLSPEDMCDWTLMTRLLADPRPLYPAGDHSTYMSMTFGWLLGEVVRRTDQQRRPFSGFVRDEVCAPLGMDSCYLGVPPEAASRVATLTSSLPARPPAVPVPLADRAIPPRLRLGPEVFNRPDIRQDGIPAVAMIANASSMVMLFAMLVGRGALAGTRLLPEQQVRSFLTPRPDYLTVDEVYGNPFPVGMGGYWVTAPEAVDPQSPPHPVLAHPGAGESIGWADLESGTAVAICRNHMSVPDFTALAGTVRRAIKDAATGADLAPG